MKSSQKSKKEKGKLISQEWHLGEKFGQSYRHKTHLPSLQTKIILMAKGNAKVYYPLSIHKQSEEA